MNQADGRRVHFPAKRTLTWLECNENKRQKNNKNMEVAGLLLLSEMLGKQGECKIASGRERSAGRAMECNNGQVRLHEMAKEFRGRTRIGRHYCLRGKWKRVRNRGRDG